MKKMAVLFLFVLGLSVFSAPVQGQNRITYTSQPDELLIFLNDIAYATDHIVIPTGMDAAVTLPSQIYPDTLVLRENGERVSDYRLQTSGGQTTLTWESALVEGDLREVTLDYLISGLGWQPKYDMWLTKDNTEVVRLDFFAEISNPMLILSNVTTTLVAGHVDLSDPLMVQTRMTTNQVIAGYQEGTGNQLGTASVDIQTLYPIGELYSQPGETVYRSVIQKTLPARRMLLWNAQAGNQVSVIYKVRNESELPLAEGIVRTYEDGVFLGSDYIEATPIGGEGSITVGVLQAMRVNRGQTQTIIQGLIERRRTQVELTVHNFNTEVIEMEIVDGYPATAGNFIFSQEAERQIGNLLRWQVTLQPGEELQITYQYDH